MQTIEFKIVGGSLKIQKTALMQEMLVSNSHLRTLLNWKSGNASTSQRPAFGEPDENGMVTIQFNNAGDINLGADPAKLLGELKQKYRGKLKGKLACRGAFYTFTLDFNSDDGEIQYIL